MIKLRAIMKKTKNYKLFSGLYDLRTFCKYPVGIYKHLQTVLRNIFFRVDKSKKKNTR